MEYKGFSNGMKPDAMWRVLLWMRSNAITGDVVTKAKQAVQAVQADPTQPEHTARAGQHDKNARITIDSSGGRSANVQACGRSQRLAH